MSATEAQAVKVAFEAVEVEAVKAVLAAVAAVSAGGAGGAVACSNWDNTLPETGYVRIWQILGDKKRGVPPKIPISKSAWWAGVASGRYPKSLKLSEKCTVWRVEDIRALLAREV